VGHTLKDVSKLILHESDNFTAEVVFKVAASKYFNKEASLDDGIKMFNEYYKAFLSNGDTLADASGVSRQDLFSTRTLANAILKLIKNEEYKNLISSPNVGTMKDRLLFLEGNLRAKTGTMRELSSFAATFKTRKQTDVLLVSIIQDSKKRKSLMKNFENTLVGLIYKKY